MASVAPAAISQNMSCHTDSCSEPFCTGPCSWGSKMRAHRGLPPFPPVRQASGAAGLSHDCPLAQFFAWARALRFADGPDEVHRAVVAKVELKRHI